jgi:peptidoglycan/xylan/chitin deacetylase (PgdA/CDA1 family)
MLALPCLALAQSCPGGIVYLTFDTGNMQSADLIADTLHKHDVKATFFLANERTSRGDYSLDASWAAYWKQRADEGHAFGSHTWRHGRIGPDAGGGSVKYRPAFGQDEGRTITLSPQEFCSELMRPDAALRALTGRGLDAIWRAPGGRTTPAALEAARKCGFAHVRWAAAGFLGDELPSERYPNKALLAQALHNVRDGDVLMAHLGIWSRHDPFAPMIDPLIAGLKQRGMCFRTLRDHPDFRSAQPPLALAAARSAR